MILTNEDGADACFIIDYSNIAYRVFFSSDNKKVRVERFIKYILNILRTFPTKKTASIVFAMDAATPDRKREIYPEYKRNRNHSSEPKLEFLEALKHIKCRVISADREEADDIISSFASTQTGEVIICSADNDFWQLGDKYTIYDIGKSKVVTKRDCVEKYKTSFKGIALYKAIFGDVSDNIKPAVPRLRKDYINHILSTSETVDDFYVKLLASNKKMPQKTLDKIVNSKSTIEMNYKLTKLSDESMKLNVEVNNPNKEMVYDFHYQNCPNLLYQSRLFLYH